VFSSKRKLSRPAEWRPNRAASLIERILAAGGCRFFFCPGTTKRRCGHQCRENLSSRPVSELMDWPRMGGTPKKDFAGTFGGCQAGGARNGRSQPERRPGKPLIFLGGAPTPCYIGGPGGGRGPGPERDERGTSGSRWPDVLTWPWGWCRPLRSFSGNGGRSAVKGPKKKQPARFGNHRRNRWLGRLAAQTTRRAAQLGAPRGERAPRRPWKARIVAICSTQGRPRGRGRYVLGGAPRKKGWGPATRNGWGGGHRGEHPAPPGRRRLPLSLGGPGQIRLGGGVHSDSGGRPASFAFAGLTGGSLDSGGGGGNWGGFGGLCELTRGTAGSKKAGFQGGNDTWNAQTRPVH